MPDERGRGRDAGRVATTRKVTMSGTTKATPAVAPIADPAPPILPTAPTTPVGRLPHGPPAARLDAAARPRARRAVRPRARPLRAHVPQPARLRPPARDADRAR